MNTTKTKKVLKIFICTLLLMVVALQVFSQQRLMEKLNRGLVAVESENGVFISWRKFALDPEGVSFNVYRNGNLVNADPIIGGSNYLDEAGTTESYYYIHVLLDEEVIEISEPAVVWENGYKDIPLQTPEGYSPNDASIADLDGDGEFEIVVKMQNTTKDNSQSGYTDPVYLHAYELNGTLLWSIDLGINIRAGAHYTQFMVYDLNGDGVAEVACKTAPGTKDGTGNYLSDGVAAGDDDAADYRNSNGYILEGPEYLTLFDGKTGVEISTVAYVPERGNVGSWGDTYGNRVDRFLACVAYFDTTPSLVMARGYYTRTVLAAWDYIDGELVQRWVFDTDVAGTGADGNDYSLYAGQGAHSLTVGDVDDDGLDEIVYGSMTVDHDGTGLYTIGNNHGDATHLGDFLPERPGMEFFMPSESAYSTNQVTGEVIPGIYLADAADGTIIWQKDVNSSADIGRAMVADVSADHPGCEFWASNPLYNLYDQDGNEINFSVEGPSINFGSWWDGDLQREVLNGNAIKKWTPDVKVSLLEPEECESNNSTKATPALSGDILGDWREEVIWRTVDNQNLRIFSTPYPTEYGLPTLLQDPQYRLALTWQNVGYNQPPHPSYYIGGGMEDPGQPDIAVAEPDIAPFIQITSPVVGYLLGLGDSLYITINVVGLSDTSSIYLSNGADILATVDELPYIVNLNMLSSGDYMLVAWGYDADMNVVESLPVPISVDQGIPSITLTSPEDGAIFGGSEDILLSADAHDSNGSVDHVTFYFNEDEAATLTEAPYSVMVENPGYGVYEVWAEVVDNEGQRDTSAVRTINIGHSTTIQESETGFCGFLGSGTVDSNNEGFTGIGFANTANQAGEGISWAIDIEEDGEYKLYWRYASVGQRAAEFTINGIVESSALEFPSTEDWTAWFLQASDVVYLTAGEYEVELTATSGNGLGNIDYMQVLSFNDLPAQALECDSLSTSVQSIYGSLNQVSIYPTPASKTVNIKILDSNTNVQRIDLYDITGKALLTKQYSARAVQLDVSRLNPGTYVVKVENDSGVVYIKQLVVD